MHQRVQWVFRPQSKTAPSEREQLAAAVEAACLKVDAALTPRLKLTTTTAEPPPRFTMIPLSARPLALVSIDTPDADALDRAAHAAGLSEMPRVGYERYRVTTSVPVALPVAPAPGDVTPGVELLTLFRRKRGLDSETFLKRWHGGHTPMSIEIHPLWGYIRNVVDARWPDTAAPLDGIVEEYFQQRRDLLDPRLFFGGSIRMLRNMVRVGWDVSTFIDMRTIETYLVNERWLRV